MSGVLRFDILGCGSSAGVPRADGMWGACDPDEPRNRRSRCSMLVRRKGSDPGGPETTVVIDTSPEFRQQSAAALKVAMPDTENQAPSAAARRASSAPEV